MKHIIRTKILLIALLILSVNCLKKFKIGTNEPDLLTVTEENEPPEYSDIDNSGKIDPPYPSQNSDHNYSKDQIINIINSDNKYLKTSLPDDFFDFDITSLTKNNHRILNNKLNIIISKINKDGSKFWKSEQNIKNIDRFWEGIKKLNCTNEYKDFIDYSCNGQLDKKPKNFDIKKRCTSKLLSIKVTEILNSNRFDPERTVFDLESLLDQAQMYRIEIGTRAKNIEDYIAFKMNIYNELDLIIYIATKSQNRYFGSLAPFERYIKKLIILTHLYLENNCCNMEKLNEVIKIIINMLHRKDAILSRNIQAYYHCFNKAITQENLKDLVINANKFIKLEVSDKKLEKDKSDIEYYLETRNLALLARYINKESKISIENINLSCDSWTWFRGLQAMVLRHSIGGILHCKKADDDYGITQGALMDIITLLEEIFIKNGALANASSPFRPITICNSNINILEDKKIADKIINRHYSYTTSYLEILERALNYSREDFRFPPLMHPFVVLLCAKVYYKSMS